MTEHMYSYRMLSHDLWRAHGEPPYEPQGALVQQ